MGHWYKTALILEESACVVVATAVVQILVFVPKFECKPVVTYSTSGMACPQQKIIMYFKLGHFHCCQMALYKYKIVATLGHIKIISI